MHANHCPECGRAFLSKHSNAATCGARCRQRAKRRRDSATAAARDARIRSLIALRSATVREGMGLGDMDAVGPELDRIDHEIDSLLSVSTRHPTG